MGWSGAAGSQVFTRTNGFNTGTTTWQSDDAQSVDITSSRHDTHDQDLSDGINSCLKKDGGNTATANLPMGGFHHTNVADATARTQYLTMGQAQDGKAEYYPTVGGTVDAITLSGASVAITAYAAGQSFRFIAAGANTGATTVNIDGVGTANIKRRDGSALSAGDLISGGLVQIDYDGTNFQVRTAGYMEGGADVAIADGGTGASTATAGFDNLAPTTTRGDLITRGASSNGRLAVGSSGQALTTDGTDVSWGTLGAAAFDASTAIPYTSLASGATATQANMETATSTATIVTPGRQHFHPGHPKAYANFDGTGTAAIRGDYGVASLTDNGTGNYTLNLDTAMSNAATMAASLVSNKSGGDLNLSFKLGDTPFTTTTVVVETGSPDTGNNADRDYICSIVMGDQ